ncbi:glycerophosphodiester phosphodiesterase [Candidatus Woesearchaeota archaeon]|nr:glycerophosphodiester phosphodiesterase [Candidatus Woesearchaeota archaeon]
MEGIEIWAHRGVHDRHPENSMAAFEEAVSRKVTGIELDARLTKDGELVVLHDAALCRTSTGTGPVRRRTAAHVAGLRLRKGGRETGEGIPTLEEAVLRLKRTVRLNIELKCTHATAAKTADRAIALLKRHLISDQAMITSFSKAAVIMVKKRLPRTTVGLIRLLPCIPKELVGIADAFVLYHRFLGRSMVSRLHRKGKRVYAFAPSTGGPLRRMRRIGVDGVITDDVDLAMSVLRPR